ncbi:hypothetical protein [Pseudonocardia acidicola]|uniref:DUF308 domain-containing protein n=1 Tax=Pseudonocardia acidicola TaxID=2724939 RepID=A0ABX1SFW2_9PSEU|nr:hypothetical protein [Pseudonocardia acidicola]NMH99447.1 hypothetical protein [Pseudonocardia acidicola]
MSHDPEERCGREFGGPEPDPIRDDFDRIVEGWRREGRVPEWPDDLSPDDPRLDDLEPDGPRLDDPRSGVSRSDVPWPEENRPAVPPRPPRAVDPAPADEDDHFVPPDPPPLPRLGPPAVIGLGLLALGLLLIIHPALVGVSSVYGLPLGLLSLAAGLGWLVLRLWPAAPPSGDGDGEDDGAVL